MDKSKSTEKPKVLDQQFEISPASSLRLHPRNANEGDIGAIHQSIEENSFYGVIVAQRSTGHILKGNHTFQAGQLAGITEFPVAWVDVGDDRALRIMLADNRTNRLGRDNEAALVELLAEMNQFTGTLIGTGYDGDDLEELINDLTRTSPTQSHAESGQAPAAYDSFSQEQKVSKSKPDAKPRFAVVVECENAAHQQEVFDELDAEGYKVKLSGGMGN